MLEDGAEGEFPNGKVRRLETDAPADGFTEKPSFRPHHDFHEKQFLLTIFAGRVAEAFRLD